MIVCMNVMVGVNGDRRNPMTCDQDFLNDVMSHSDILAIGKIWDVAPLSR